MKNTLKLATVLLGLLAIGALGAGCAATTDSEELASTAAAAATQAPKLNLSHIECNEDGTVNAHFVLLFAGTGTPGALTGTWSGGTFSDPEPDKLSGNVWHYNVTLPSGYIEITGAQTTTSWGATVTLHNPGEYTGDYVCGPETCDLGLAPYEFCAPASDLGNPGAECDYIDPRLDTTGKDDNLGGQVWSSTQTTYVAIVKTGRSDCAKGEVKYNVYVGVTAGEPLYPPSNGDKPRQDISHVTYCDCE